MKFKFSYIVCIFFLFLAFTAFFANSVSAIGFKTNIPDSIMGVSCGLPGSPDTDKCCRPATLNLDLNSSNPILSPITGVLTFMFDNTIGGLVYNAGQITKKMGSSAVCYQGSEPIPNENDPSCRCLPKKDQSTLKAAAGLCNFINSPTEKKECLSCLNVDLQYKKAGVWTAIGCVYSDVPTFIQRTLLSWGIGLAGLVATLCIIYAAFTLQISRGNPEKIKKAQEMLTSCITGLLLIIFSVFILRLIGVDILKIPGFF